MPTTPSLDDRLSPRRLREIRAATLLEEAREKAGTVDTNDPVAEAMYKVIRELLAHIDSHECLPLLPKKSVKAIQKLVATIHLGRRVTAEELTAAEVEINHLKETVDDLEAY